MAIIFYKPGKDVELSRDQLEFYNRNGYLIIENLLSIGECDDILGKFNRHMDEDFSCILNFHRRSKLAAQDPRDKTLEVMVEIEETSKLALDLMRDRRCVSVIDQLQIGRMRKYGRSATGHMDEFVPRDHVGLMSILLYKKPGTQYAGQAWNVHQDNAYPQNPYGLYITVSIILADIDRENGTVFVYPGSHEEGLLPHAPQKSYREDSGKQPGNIASFPEKYRGTEVDIIAKKGAVFFMNGNTLHGSYPNLSDRPRPIHINTYIPNGEEYAPGKIAGRSPILLTE